MMISILFSELYAFLLKKIFDFKNFDIKSASVSAGKHLKNTT